MTPSKDLRSRLWRFVLRTRDRLAWRLELARARRRGEPPMRLFRNIYILPPDEPLIFYRPLPGGPVWPQTEAREAVAHRFAGARRERPLRKPDAPDVIFHQPCLWGGYVRHHFGHLVSEQMTRLLWSARRRPRDQVLFIADPGETLSSLPSYFWELAEWLGLGKDRVRLVTQTSLVTRLRVMPQAEHIEGPAPPTSYLKLLEANQRRHKLAPIPSRLLFVDRHAMLAAGSGGTAGGGYLSALLEQIGLTVIAPERLSLRAQLQHYLGAKVIVFPEGSAIHGRQLLGRLDQKIIVLNRRPGSRMAAAEIGCRVSELTYVEATPAILVPIADDGRRRYAHALSFYNLSALFTAFLAVGVDLNAHWDMKAFVAAESTDLTAWRKQYPGALEIKGELPPHAPSPAWLKAAIKAQAKRGADGQGFDENDEM